MQRILLNGFAQLGSFLYLPSITAVEGHTWASLIKDRIHKKQHQVSLVIPDKAMLSHLVMKQHPGTISRAAVSSILFVQSETVKVVTILWLLVTHLY